MALIAEPETPTPDGPQHGFVVTVPATVADPFTVRLPSFGADFVFEIVYWVPRGAALPGVGDRVLVVFDDEGEPWVTAWWPS